MAVVKSGRAVTSKPIKQQGTLYAALGRSRARQGGFLCDAALRAAKEEFVYLEPSDTCCSLRFQCCPLESAVGLLQELVYLRPINPIDAAPQLASPTKANDKNTLQVGTLGQK